jgi:hypothetical protein
LPDIEIEDSEMEQLGFFAEDRVKLRSKKIVETIISEEEEEVGSIRRMAFAGQSVRSKSLSIDKNKSAASSKKTVKKSKKKKSSSQKSHSVKRPKSLKHQKSKSHKRGVK